MTGHIVFGIRGFVKLKIQTKSGKSQKVATLKLNDEAYQVIIRWAVQQGATGNDEMSILFSDSIMKATLPGQRGLDKNGTSKIESKNEPNKLDTHFENAIA